MRSIFSTILLISSLVALSGESDTRTIIWYDGSSFYKSLNKKKNATVFFSEWSSGITQFLEDDNYKVALQLNTSFDPLPEDEMVLPTIAILSSIDDEALVTTYLDFLENLSRTAGFNYLILPDTLGRSLYEKELIKLAERKSPYFFISAAKVSWQLPVTKQELVDFPAIWITDQSNNIRKLSKKRKKLTRDFDEPFYQALRSEKHRDFPSVTSYPDGLAQEIFESSATAIDPWGLLPLKEEAIVYRGNDLELKARLEKYVRVYTEVQDEDDLVILDCRDGFAEVVSNSHLKIDLIGSPRDDGAHLLVSGICENDDIFLSKMLFGAKRIIGRTEGSRQIQLPGFIGYTFPSYEGLNGDSLVNITDLVTEAIRKQATPGAQLTVVKNGSIILEETYGHYTYDSLKEVSYHTLYDLASITKVAATLPAVALLIDQEKISLDDSISQHLAAFKGSNKSGVTIRQLLAHNAGIRSYIPFWSRAMDGDRLDVFYYENAEAEAMDIRTYGVEPHPALSDTLKNWIVKSDLIKNPEKYNYSDLGFMILHLLVESVSGEPFDQFVDANFYHPMNLKVTFNPRNQGVGLEEIAPTEYDQRYRNDQVWGEVHDRNAHIFGGVSGHAGLFSNASDLAKMMYMLANDGYYEGRQYLKPGTLAEFNRRHFKSNRRGLGWDKKDYNRDSASAKASDSSYGHTGFTGTMVWTDPEKDLIFVFLSNRVYPDSENQKLSNLDTRTKIHDAIYESLLDE